MRWVYIFEDRDRNSHQFLRILSNLLIIFKSSKISWIIFKFFPELSRDLHLFLLDL
ncbi:hypothetical protein Hanom_Chr06g00497481 [Helianthus anomalus]